MIFIFKKTAKRRFNLSKEWPLDDATNCKKYDRLLAPQNHNDS
jgi:hypothetical protein